jgi:hypothetical protein
MSKGKYFIFSFIILSIFFICISFAGIFKIGILSDTFSDAYTAVNSTALDKISNNLEYIDTYRYRPVLFLTLKGIVGLNKLLGISFDNFIVYRLINILFYFLFAYISGLLVLKISGKVKSAIFTEAVVLIFPNNLHNLCWTAAYFELMCGIFYLLAIIFILEYVNENSKRFLIYSTILFVLAVLTKEIAVTFPFVCMVILLLLYGKSVFNKFKVVLISQFSVLLLYFISKNFLSRGIPVLSGKYFEGGFLSNSVRILAQSFVASVFPFDFSALRLWIKEFDLFVIIYFVLVFVFSVILLFKILRKRHIKRFLSVCFIFLLLISPYIYAGYIRPQLILLPFAVTVVVFMSFIRLKSFALKSLSILFLIFWLFVGLGVISGWKAAYTEGKERLENVLNMDFAKDKKTVIIGNPARFQQFFMFDNIMFPYNYFKYHDFIIKDTLSDLVRTIALDRESLNSELNVSKIGNKECEISCTGKTQFFYLSGNEAEIIKNNGLKTDFISVEFLDFNEFGKPVKIKLKFLSGDTENYIFRGNEIIKIN